jgi:hypothetical protein
MLCLAAALGCGTASAATIDLHWDANPFNPSGPTDSINYTINGTNGSVMPDRYHGTATNLVGISESDLIDGINGSIYTYCYELTQTFTGGSTVHYTLNAAAVTAATLDFLGAVNSVLGSATPFGWLDPINAFGVIPAVNIAAAIQIGIWETRYDTTWNLLNGHFSATGIDAPTQSALTLFQNAMASSPDLGAQYVVKLENADRQDQITGLRPTGRQLPEPGSLALLALAVAAAIGTRRARRS